jgi:hypothetical protein
MNQERRLQEKTARKKIKEAQQEESSDLKMLQNDMFHLKKMVTDLLALNEGD